MPGGSVAAQVGPVTAAPVVVAALHRAAAAVRHHVEIAVLRRADLSWTGFSVLTVVCTHQSVETRNAAAMVGISRGTLTGVVRTLEGKALLRRVPHSTDGRLVLLEPTAAGRRLFRRLQPRVRAAEDYAVSSLENGERDALTDLLHRVAADLGTT